MTDKAIAAASFLLRDAPSAAQRLRCVLGMLNSLEVKVLSHLILAGGPV